MGCWYGNPSLIGANAEKPLEAYSMDLTVDKCVQKCRRKFLEETEFSSHTIYIAIRVRRMKYSKVGPFGCVGNLATFILTIAFTNPFGLECIFSLSQTCFVNCIRMHYFNKNIPAYFTMSCELSLVLLNRWTKPIPHSSFVCLGQAGKQCFCGRDLRGEGEDLKDMLPAISGCDLLCSGNDSQLCGGEMGSRFYSIYRAGDCPNAFP